MTENVLSLDYKDAMDFFLSSDRYHGFELPEYFVFDEMLQSVRNIIGDTPYEECLKDKNALPDQLTGVNLDIMLNKDGHYAVRPIMLANPFLYYFLVREICNEKAWTIIKDMFRKFNVPHLTSCALPVIPKENGSFHNSTAIINWWNSMEQRSIELSLEYRYMFVTDITNCYGSVNPQAFEWAFNMRHTKYERKCEMPIAKNIQTYMRALQQGRNIGIPQGNAIFDFAGEIILGYSDLLLNIALKKKKIKSAYEIIRYRDDYRIFCNNKDDLEEISYTLQNVLESLNFRMNSQKTRICSSIVTDAIKPDKLAYIYNTPILSNDKGDDFDTLEKHLLYILMFARHHPDSGAVKTMLGKLNDHLQEKKKEKEDEKKKKEEEKKESNWKLVKTEVVNLSWEDTDKKDKKDNKKDNKKEVKANRKEVDKKDNEKILKNQKRYHKSEINNYYGIMFGGSARAIAAVCTQIALENINCCHYALRILSRIIDTLNDEKEKWDIIDKVYKKLCKQPNSTYNQLWLQNMTYQQDKKKGKSTYDFGLCKLVAGKYEKDEEPLWNNDWLKDELASKLEYKTIVDQETLKKVTPVITFREREKYILMHECL